MFNIGFAELLLVLVIAYVIVGPKDLPKVARWLGRMVRRARQLIRELKEEVGWNEMPMIDGVSNAVVNYAKNIEAHHGHAVVATPAVKEADVSAELKDAQRELRQSVTSAEKEAMKK